MELVKSIQRGIDFMEMHLLEPVTIEEVAAQANISVFHFQRLFTVLTDLSIGEYLRGRRLTLAAQEVINTEGKIIDIAYKYGNETPEAFTKAFRRQHGITPSEARKQHGKLKSFDRLASQLTLKGAEPMKNRIDEKGRFRQSVLNEYIRCRMERI